MNQNWRKSSKSPMNCVEARYENVVEVRDTKDRTGPTLSFTAKDWKKFLRTL